MDDGDEIPVTISVGTTDGATETIRARRYEMQLSRAGDLSIHVNPHTPATSKVFGWAARFWLWYEIEAATEEEDGDE